MIERTSPLFGNLVFDRNAIVRAALRAYVEAAFRGLGPSANLMYWTGDLQRGALLNCGGSPDYEVVAWTEVGVVGLAFELRWGPIELLGLSIDEVTGGPDDVRGTVPDLPEELEPAFVRAVGMLDVGPEHGEKWAGAGFWLCGDHAGGTLFVADNLTDAPGVTRLAAWGLLRGDRLPHACGDEIELEPDHPAAVPFQAIIDAVTARALTGPTELMPAELETLLYPETAPAHLLIAQRRLQEVGITWPGSPELPEEPKPSGIDPFKCK